MIYIKLCQRFKFKDKIKKNKSLNIFFQVDI